MPLLLGDVLFQDFEIPERITGLGGKQSLAKHRMIGGARVVNAMGPDDDDPRWSGRFQGGDAAGRARQLDAMRISGQEFILSFGSFLYSVVIEEFTFAYEREYQATYQIRLYVVSNITADVELSLVDLVVADLGVFSSLVSNFVAGF